MVNRKVFFIPYRQGYKELQDTCSRDYDVICLTISYKLSLPFQTY